MRISKHQRSALHVLLLLSCLLAVAFVVAATLAKIGAAGADALMGKQLNQMPVVGWVGTLLVVFGVATVVAHLLDKWTQRRLANNQPGIGAILAAGRQDTLLFLQAHKAEQERDSLHAGTPEAEGTATGRGRL